MILGVSEAMMIRSYNRRYMAGRGAAIHNGSSVVHKNEPVNRQKHQEMATWWVTVDNVWVIQKPSQRVLEGGRTQKPQERENPVKSGRCEVVDGTIGKETSLC
jgi:hypothetical protein